MARYRTFSHLFIGVFVSFLLLHLVVWKLWTDGLMFGFGDLARLGYYPLAKVPREEVVDLPRRHLELSDYHGQHVDVVTIGDSFSQGWGGGKNRFYQDYIASFNNLSVLNICVTKHDPVGLLVSLLNNGYLRQIRPKYLVLEICERGCPLLLTKRVDFSVAESSASLLRHAADHRIATNPSRLSPVNNANLKFLYYSVMYHFTDNPTGQVYAKRLGKDLFSGSAADRLLFYYLDIESAKSLHAADVDEINENLNRLSEMAADAGIKLYFMPAVDKSNLYREYMLDKSFTRSIFFEELRKRPKKYVMIDTKALLSSELAHGEKDVFFPDDSHWSWKASKKIFSTTRFDGGELHGR